MQQHYSAKNSKCFFLYIYVILVKEPVIKTPFFHSDLVPVQCAIMEMKPTLQSDLPGSGILLPVSVMALVRQC